jgi:hypothetical protein
MEVGLRRPPSPFRFDGEMERLVLRQQPLDEGDPVGDGAYDLKAVQTVVGDVFMKTPEFSTRFIYKFLNFWSCSTDSPWIWDGSQGGVFHMGLGTAEFNDIVALHAPLPAQFGEPVPEIEKHIAEMENKNVEGNK